MKIGILTHHWVYNMGAQLQCMSTYYNLTQLGHNAVIINYVPDDDLVFQKQYVLVSQINVHEEFLQHFECSRICRNSIEIADEIKRLKIEAVIVGSDAVFNIRKPRRSRSTLKMCYPLSNHVFPNPFWAEFKQFGLDNLPVVALSVSSQNASFKSFYKEKEDVGNALYSFSKIYVRDDWTKKMVKYFTQGHISPDITPDPVFGFNNAVAPLFTRDEIIKKFSIPEDYVLISFDNSRFFAEKWVNRLVNEFKTTNIVPVELWKIIGNREISVPRKILPPISPLEWYHLIKYSKGYIGVLMHPIVVSLHNMVPFYSFDTYGKPNVLGFKDVKSSKTYHIVKSAGLLSNYYHCNYFKPMPSPKRVVQAIMEFDVNKCTHFAHIQAHRFKETITTIINIFENEICRNY